MINTQVSPGSFPGQGYLSVIEGDGAGTLWWVLGMFNKPIQCIPQLAGLSFSFRPEAGHTLKGEGWGGGTPCWVAEVGVQSKKKKGGGVGGVCGFVCPVNNGDYSVAVMKGEQLGSGPAAGIVVSPLLCLKSVLWEGGRGEPRNP